MRKGRTVIGQDVYSLADGRRVHSVKDLVVSEDHDAIVALLVDEGGLLGTSTIVPIEAVHRFGPDAVMVEDSSAVIPASADERVAATLDRKAQPPGDARRDDQEGERVGPIGDMYFDEVTGEILGYEVSGGTVGDVMRGTSWLPLDGDRRSSGRTWSSPRRRPRRSSSRRSAGCRPRSTRLRDRQRPPGQDLAERARSRRSATSRGPPPSEATAATRSRTTPMGARRPARHHGRDRRDRLDRRRQRPARDPRARPASA